MDFCKTSRFLSHVFRPLTVCDALFWSEFRWKSVKNINPYFLYHSRKWPGGKQPDMGVTDRQSWSRCCPSCPPPLVHEPSTLPSKPCPPLYLIILPLNPPLLPPYYFIQLWPSGSDSSKLSVHSLANSNQTVKTSDPKAPDVLKLGAHDKSLFIISEFFKWQSCFSSFISFSLGSTNTSLIFFY